MYSLRPTKWHCNVFGHICLSVIWQLSKTLKFISGTWVHHIKFVCQILFCLSSHVSQCQHCHLTNHAIFLGILLIFCTKKTNNITSFITSIFACGFSVPHYAKYHISSFRDTHYAAVSLINLGTLSHYWRRHYNTIMT